MRRAPELGLGEELEDEIGGWRGGVGYERER